MEITIQQAAAEHLEGILEIVNHNILHTTAVYDYAPRSMQDMEQWLEEKRLAGWPVIVAEHDGSVLGYGTYGSFRTKEAYKFTVEHSVYVSEKATGKGIGSLLLPELIGLAKEHGYHMMIGCIDAGNTGSIDFHKRFGFTDAGLVKEAGYKFGRWLDLQFVQLILR